MKDYTNELIELNNEVGHFAMALPELEREVAELEYEAGIDGFWNDVEYAKKQMNKLAQVKLKVSRITTMTNRVSECVLLMDWRVLGEASDAEVDEAFAKLRESVERYKQQLYLSGKYDSENAILTLHAGSGGDESCDFTDMILRALLRWAESAGLDTKLTDVESCDVAGVKSAIIELKGENAYGYAKALNGVFRLVRISPFDAAGRRHTSFMAIDVLPDLHITDEVSVSIDDCDIATFRSGGNGGQYQNKTDSGVRLTHRPTGLIVECREERSQLQNKNRCLEKLKTLIYLQQQNDLANELFTINGEKTENGWGNAICSIVLMPYQLVKDNRTGWETSQTDNFLDGELDGFIQAYLCWLNSKEKENDKS